MIETLALAVLIYFGIATLWDLFDPDAVTMKFGSPFRAIAAVTAQVMVILLACATLALSTAAIVAIFAGIVIIALLAALLDR